MIHTKANRRPKRGAPLRNWGLLVFASLFALLSAPLSASGVPRLFVFANADMRAHTLEKDLEDLLPGVDVTVFSRIREFEVAMQERPEGALARRVVLESLGLQPALQGHDGGKSTERFVLVAANRQASVSELQGKTLGAVDILGRKNMDDFVSNVLGASAPKLKYVTHERDLLALLQFEAAAAVMTSEKWAELFRSKSEMKLTTSALPNEVSLVAVAFSSPSARSALEGKLVAAAPRLKDKLGVTQWR